MSAALPREFLVQRLVADCMSSRDSKPLPSTGSHSDGEDRTSDSSSEPGVPDPHPEMLQQQAAFQASFMSAPMQYAATLASLAQMNFFQPTANTLPLLYPHLYQSLLTFPNLDQIRTAIASPPKSLVNGSKPGTPDTANSTRSTNLSPSPRKRKDTASKPKSEAKVPRIEADSSPQKRQRAIKKLQFDEETQSPVSGMFIREAACLPPAEQLQAEADLDDSANFVEITEEAIAELAKISNVIGDYVCCLCKVKYEDAFRLAQHRCPRIVHEEYRCPECDKCFSCPANLASHRRWHKPKTTEPKTINIPRGVDERFKCELCDKEFDSHRMLRDHAICHTDFAPKDLPESPAECPECFMIFPSVASVEKHRSVAHQKFLCKFCQQLFGTSPALMRHINKHHPSSDCRVVMLQEQNGH